MSEEITVIIIGKKKFRQWVVEKILALEELKAQLHAELADDPAAQAKIDAFMEQLADNKQKMADAMAANVPPA